MNTAYPSPTDTDHPLHTAQSFFLDGYEIRIVPCGETALWLYRGLGEAASFRDLGVVRWSIVHPPSLTVSVAFLDWAPHGSPRATLLLSMALRVHDTNNDIDDQAPQWWSRYETSPRTQPESALLAQRAEEVPIAMASFTALKSTSQGGCA